MSAASQDIIGATANDFSPRSLRARRIITESHEHVVSESLTLVTRQLEHFFEEFLRARVHKGNIAPFTFSTTQA